MVIGVEAASILIPILINIVIILILYWFVSRYWDQVAAYATIIVWALAPYSVLVTSAGYLDRDGLSVLLVLLAVIGVFEIGRQHTIKARCMLTIGIAGITCAQWAQWHIAGSIVILVIATAIILYRAAGSPRIKPIIWALGLLSGYCLATVLVDAMGINTDEIGEFQAIRMADIFLYWGWTVPLILAGIIIDMVRPALHTTMIMIWIVIVLAGAGAVSRVMVFSLPAISIISGVAVSYGLARYTAAGGSEMIRLKLVQAVILVIAVTLITTSILSALSLQSVPRMAASKDWQNALDYIRTNTPVESRVACLGSHKYWVIALGDRLPAHGSSQRSGLTNLRELYCTDNALSFGKALERCGADYFICSTWEYDEDYVLNRLTEAIGGAEISCNDSLARGTVYGDETDLNVVYRNESVAVFGVSLTEPSDQSAGRCE